MKLLRIWVALGGLRGLCSTSTGQGMSATPTLMPTSGNTAMGTVTFTQNGDKVAVTAKVSGLSPGSHRFQIHARHLNTKSFPSLFLGDGADTQADTNPDVSLVNE